MSTEPKYAHEVARCPQCLRVGLRYQNGSWCCDACDRCYRADTVGHHNKAFEQGREFERNLRLPEGEESSRPTESELRALYTPPPEG